MVAVSRALTRPDRRRIAWRYEKTDESFRAMIRLVGSAIAVRWMSTSPSAPPRPNTYSNRFRRFSRSGADVLDRLLQRGYDGIGAGCCQHSPALGLLFRQGPEPDE